MTSLEQKIAELEKEMKKVRYHSGHHQQEMVSLKANIRQSIEFIKSGNTEGALQILEHECRVNWMTPQEQKWWENKVITPQEKEWWENKIKHQ